MSKLENLSRSIEARGDRLSDVQLGLLLADLRLRAENVLR
jgi:hypothetical protein